MSLTKRVTFQQRLHNLRGMIHLDHVPQPEKPSHLAWIFYLGLLLGLTLLAYHGYTLWVKKEGTKKKFIVDSRNVFSYEGTPCVPEETEEVPQFLLEEGS